MNITKTQHGVQIHTVHSVDIGWSKERLVATSDHFVYFEALNSDCVHCDTCQRRLREVTQLLEASGIKRAEEEELDDGWCDEVAAWDHDSRKWHYFISIPLPKEFFGKEIEYLQGILKRIPIKPLTRF